MEEKLENTLRFYVLATQLKYKVRSGWDDTHWNISGKRRESIAEHIYGTCILAIALDSEFKTDLDLEKVIMMLVLHELGEVLIGDITPFDNIPKEQKVEIEFKAIREVLGDLQKNKVYYDLLKEFDQKKTKEAVLPTIATNLRLTFRLRFIKTWDVNTHSMSRMTMWSFEAPRFRRWQETAQEPLLTSGTSGTRVCIKMTRIS